MKPIKVICPICGEEMVATEYGMKRYVYQSINGEAYPGETYYNYVDYECSCGCEMHYKGTKSCWQKKCGCKSCAKFQKHYPYEACECESGKKWESEPR